MQTGTVLVAMLFVLTSYPFLGHGAAQAGTSQAGATAAQSSPSQQTQQSSPSEQQASSTATSTAAPAPEMKPVKAELVNKLDTKTAKAGDEVVVQTKSSVTTAQGVQIPSGSKLMGHVVGVQAATAGKNSEVAVQFDHAEMAGGKNVPIESEIQSVGSASNESANQTADAAAGMTPPSASVPGSSSGAMGPTGAEHGPAAPSSSPGVAPGSQPPQSSATPSARQEPPAGTVVATTGAISIRTTSVPGVLLANNQPGQRDPRMAQASSVLLGARKDVQLEGGTPMVLGVAAESGTR